MASTTTAPPAPTDRQPSAPAPPAKPPCKIHSLATVADRAQLTGTHEISIGDSTLIHPHARLRAETGPVTIGSHCIVAEKSTIGGTATSAADETAATLLGDGVSIGPSATISPGTRIGDWTTINAAATVHPGAVVGKWCTIGALCEVRAGEVLEDFTVMYGYGARRVDVAAREREEVREVRMRGRKKEGELLKGLIPDAGAKWRG